MVFEQIFGLISNAAMMATFGSIFIFALIYFPLENIGFFNPVQKHHSPYEVLYAKVSDGFTWKSMKHFKIIFVILGIWIVWMLTRGS